MKLSLKNIHIHQMVKITVIQGLFYVIFLV